MKNPTSHGFMGVRVAFAADIADFIKTAAERKSGRER